MEVEPREQAQPSAQAVEGIGPLTKVGLVSPKIWSAIIVARRGIVGEYAVIRRRRRLELAR